MENMIRIKSKCKLLSAFNRENCTTHPQSRYCRVTIENNIVVFHHVNGRGVYRLRVEVDRATHIVFTRNGGWEETCGQLAWNI